MGDLKPAQDGIAAASNSIPGADRPLVTFALFAYNQELFIREAVEGAFAQTYEPLEIILSDDCSTDGTFRIMQEMAEQYAGPHRVILNMNPENLGSRGIGLHVNRVFELSEGELFVFAAGDDISQPERVSTLVDAWAKVGCPEGSVHSAVRLLSTDASNGRVVEGRADFEMQSVMECIQNGACGVFGAAHAVTRGVFDKFGMLPDGTLFEDRALAFRSRLLGRIIYVDVPLVAYRQHGENITGLNIYLDKIKWNRWLNGLLVKYEGFARDYRMVRTDKHETDLVIKTVKSELRRVRLSKYMASDSALLRAWSAASYSKGMITSDRVSFVIQRVGLQNSIIFRMLSSIWRLYKLCVKYFNKN